MPAGQISTQKALIPIEQMNNNKKQTLVFSICPRKQARQEPFQLSLAEANECVLYPRKHPKYFDFNL
jgi:hypothetical protein